MAHAVQLPGVMRVRVVVASLAVLLAANSARAEESGSAPPKLSVSGEAGGGVVGDAFGYELSLSARFWAFDLHGPAVQIRYEHAFCDELPAPDHWLVDVGWAIRGETVDDPVSMVVGASVGRAAAQEPLRADPVASDCRSLEGTGFRFEHFDIGPFVRFDLDLRGAPIVVGVGLDLGVRHRIGDAVAFREATFVLFVRLGFETLR